MEQETLECELEATHNPNLYKCKNCGIIFQKREITKQLMCTYKINKLEKNPIKNLSIKFVGKEIIKKDTYHTNSANNKKDYKLCSQKQIDDRLSICQKCEYYENNTCLKCGCALSRDMVFMNKLYLADQSCPIGKWGPIETESPE